MRHAEARHEIVASIEPRLTEAGSERAESRQPLTGANGRFIAVYTLAQIGAFIGFVPLLGVLLPLKAAQIAPLGASLLLSQAAIAGSVAAAVGHLLTGIASDLTRSPIGRRRPWIIAGALLTCLSFRGVQVAQTPGEVILAIVGFQLAFNILFAPLVAVFAEVVPDGKKGLVSAFTGLAYPIANLFSAFVVALALTDSDDRYFAIGAAMVVLAAPFVILGYREPIAVPRRKSEGLRILQAFTNRDFVLAFVSRLLVQTAIAVNALYLLYYLQQDADVSTALGSMRVEAVLGLLIGTGTAVALATGFVTGIWSDRLGRRRMFVSVGGLGVALGAAVLALVPDWPGPLVGQLIYGAGLGIFTTADTAFIAQVLPTRASIGRDLGLMNIAVMIPQLVAPLAGIVLLTGLGWSLTTVFALASMLAVAGGLLVHGVKGTA